MPVGSATNLTNSEQANRVRPTETDRVTPPPTQPDLDRATPHMRGPGGRRSPARGVGVREHPHKGTALQEGRPFKSPDPTGGTCIFDKGWMLPVGTQALMREGTRGGHDDGSAA